MYIHCTVLGMKEESFWHTTPRILFGLYDVHKKVNGLEGENESEEQLDFIDNLAF